MLADLLRAAQGGSKECCQDAGGAPSGRLNGVKLDVIGLSGALGALCGGQALQPTAAALAGASAASIDEPHMQIERRPAV